MMKNKSLLLVASAFMLMNSWSNAQDQVLITTEYDEPYKNVLNIGAYVGLDVQAQSSGGLYYGFAGRYTLPKLLTLQANIALDLAKQSKGGGLIKVNENLLNELTSYKNIELRGVFHFRDSETKKSHKVELGRSGDYEYSTNYSTKARSIQGITASLNINSRIFVQNRDSMVSIAIKDPTNSYADYIDGLATSQNFMFFGFGLHSGEYTNFKGKFSAAPVGTKRRRIKKSVSANIEFLFAPFISVSDKAYLSNNDGSITEFEIEDVKKKNMGFRLSCDVVSGKPGMYMRMELGKKPGIEAPLRGDSKMAKLLTNGYVSFAIGLGF